MQQLAYSVVFAVVGAYVVFVFWSRLCRIGAGARSSFGKSTSSWSLEPVFKKVEIKNVCGDLMEWLLGAIVCRLLGCYRGYRALRVEYQNAVETGPPVSMHGSAPSVPPKRMYPPLEEHVEYPVCPGCSEANGTEGLAVVRHAPPLCGTSAERM